MRFYILLTFFVFINCFTSTAQSDWMHPKVYKRNLVNGLISKEGKPIFKATNNTSLKRATYYEYFNDRVKTTTDYFLNENGRHIYFTFRSDLNSNEFVQIVQMPSSPSPSYSSVTIADNEKKEVTDHGIIYGIYRSGSFIDLLYTKSVRGKLLMQN